MKALSFIAFFLCCLTIAKAQDASDQTLVKSFDTENATSVKIEFKNNQINPQPWDGQAFRIELVIKANMPIQVLEQLVKAGRYSLDGSKSGDEFVVSAPNLEKSVVVRGKTLEEQISVNIKTPGYYALADQTLAKDATAMRGQDEAQLAEYMKIKSPIEIPVVIIESTLAKPDVDLKLKDGDIKIDGEDLIIQKD